MTPTQEIQELNRIYSIPVEPKESVWVGPVYYALLLIAVGILVSICMEPK